MARGPRSRPWSSLGVVAFVIAAMYALMTATGTLTPKLGLDLQGGTTVTLTPRLSQGSGAVPKGALSEAVDIIRQRVNGLGVAEADVVELGGNIVISVPGKGRDQVVQLVGQTAQLRFRQVYAEQASVPNATPTPGAGLNGPPTSSASPSGPPSAGPAPGASSSAAPNPRALSAALSAHAGSPAGPLATSAAIPPTSAPKATPPKATPAPRPAATPAATAGPSGPAGGTPSPNPSGAGSNTPPADVQATFNRLDCSGPNPSAGQIDNPADWTVACDRQGVEKYLLRPATVVGTDVKGAQAQIQQLGGQIGATGGGFVVSLSFTGSGQTKWTHLTQLVHDSPGCPTSSGPECQVAIVLDGIVQSSPVIQDVIFGDAQISGTFTQKQAEDLANVLKYGALPLAFTQSQVESISATLGSDSLRAGLLAGLIGLALVLVYSFLYYRLLGIVVVLSLSVSALLVYGSVSLLGQGIGFTLTLAGIAGLIVSVGITADSFVVFFERIKDEVRDGKSARSGTEYGWVRARRTIFTADAVSFLAALILYLVSIGSVRGFAFTLGVSTLLDIFTVILFTRPLVTLLVRRPLFATSRLSGLAATTGTTRGAPRPGQGQGPRRTGGPGGGSAVRLDNKPAATARGREA